jgi:Flp pilus assembly protein TadG
VQPVIIIFLLLFAILAFGWFYLQRAKARDAAAGGEAVAATAAPEASAAPPAADPVAPAEADTARPDQSTT